MNRMRVEVKQNMKRVAVKKEYRMPIESFERALVEMGFYKTRTTPMTVQYKRSDGLHVVLSSRSRKKGRASRKVKREVGKGKITIMKVHKDDLLTHRAIKLNGYERGKFLGELISLAKKWWRGFELSP